MPNIILQSADGEYFKVDVEIAKCSGMIKTMLAELGIDEEEIVPLPRLNSDILNKVIEWCTHHKDDPSPSEDDIINKKRITDVSTWDAEFLFVNKETLFELISAADYLSIEGLYDLGCITVAKMLKGKTAEQIRQEFNIKNDYTALDEEEQL